jgi:hypothetical protein
MKTIITLIVLHSFLFLVRITQGQTSLPVVIEVTGLENIESFNSMFDELDKSKIKTGILYDKTISFSEIFKYNGIESTELITLNIWKQIYFELKNCSFEKPILSPLSKVNEYAKNLYSQNITPIAIINVNYNKINQNALENNSLYINNGKLYDNKNSSVNPYDLKKVFAATALKSKYYLGNHQFTITDDFIFTNDTTEISYFEIDFDDGEGFKSYTKNEIINIDYICDGEKTINVIAKFKNGSELGGRFEIIIKQLIFCNPPEPDNQFTITSKITDFPWHNTGSEFDINENLGKAEVSIWYAQNSNKLTKPIIIVDGIDLESFDSPDSRNWRDIYHNLCQMGTIDSLRQRCFDIIIVDWHGGADWIQKNAFCFLEVLNWVNNNKIGFNKNIVIGPSMGGIITRYALAYMEENNIKHDVSHFISFDAPHRGSNFPLGFQAMMYFFGPFQQYAMDGIKMLNSPASKQLLFYQMPEEDVILSPHPLRNQLIEELTSHGNYPHTCTKIAIANGSGIGKNQHNGIGDIMYPNSNIFEYSEYVFESKVWALPDSDLSKIFYGKAVTPITLLPYAKYLYVSNTHPYDNSPGGYYHGLVDLLPENSTFYFPYLTFMPTISTLDMDHTINDLSYPPAIQLTPFDYIIFTTESKFPEPHPAFSHPYAYNQAHMSITSTTRDFILNILADNIPHDLYIQNKIFYPNPIQETVTITALHNIVAGFNVDNSQPFGEVIVTAGNDIEFIAGERIVLKPGFKVQKGAKFQAILGTPSSSCTFFKLNNANIIQSSCERTYESDIYVTKNESMDINESFNIYNYPNPFSDQTQFHFSLNDSYYISLTIYDLFGRKIETLINNQYYNAGYYEATMTTVNLQPGIYIYILNIDNYLEKRKMIKIK